MVITRQKLKTLMTMVGNRKEVSPEMRRVFNRLMAQAVTLGFGNVIDWMRGRKENGSEGDWETMSPEKRKELLDAAMNTEQVPDAPEEDPEQNQNDP